MFKKGGVILKIFFAALLNALSVLPMAIAISHITELAGGDFTSTFAGIFLSASVGTVLFARRTNMPFIFFPNLALIVSFYYVEIISRGTPLETVLGAAFIAAFTGGWLVFFKWDKKIVDFFPERLVSAFFFGISLFLIAEGLKLAEILLPSPFNFAMTGDLYSPLAFASIVGILVFLLIFFKNHSLSVLGAVLFTLAVSYLNGYIAFDEIVAPPALPGKGFFTIDILAGLCRLDLVFELLFIMWVVSHMMVDTLSRLPDNVEKMPKVGVPLFASNVLASLLGVFMLMCSPFSTVGIASGGQNARVSYATAGFFVMMIFFEPAAKSLVDFPVCFAVAMVGAGIFMISHAKNNEDFLQGDFAEILSAILIIFLIPATGNILGVIGFSLILYIMLKCLSGKFKDISLGAWVIGVLFIVNYMIKECFF